MDESRIRHLFEVCDLNGSGYIEYDDLRDICLGSDLEITDAELGSVFDELDTDRDGRISADEFEQGFQGVEELLRRKVKSSGGSGGGGGGVSRGGQDGVDGGKDGPRRGQKRGENNNGVTGKDGKVTPAYAAWQGLVTSLGPGVTLLPRCVPQQESSAFSLYPFETVIIYFSFSYFGLLNLIQRLKIISDA